MVLAFEVGTGGEGGGAAGIQPCGPAPFCRVRVRAERDFQEMRKVFEGIDIAGKKEYRSLNQLTGKLEAAFR
jgi:hypothetical protein